MIKDLDEALDHLDKIIDHIRAVRVLYDAGKMKPMSLNHQLAEISSNADDMFEAIEEATLIVAEEDE